MKMKIIVLVFTAVVSMVAIQACNKKDDTMIQPNAPPVAYAGNDTTIIIAVCKPTTTARLDGHLSYDPGNNNSLGFLWKQVSGPTRAFDGIDSTRDVITITNLVSGEYKFELEVVDPNGLSTTDSLNVIINNNTAYKDLELDVTGSFEFFNNTEHYNYFYDEFSLSGIIIIANKSYAYNFYESSDSAVINSRFKNYFNLYVAAGAPRFINGECSVDFDELYLNGGGPFDGTISIFYGSAFVGCESMMQDFPIFQVTGNLNAQSKTISMKIRGDIIL